MSALKSRGRKGLIMALRAWASLARLDKLKDPAAFACPAGEFHSPGQAEAYPTSTKEQGVAC